MPSFRRSPARGFRGSPVHPSRFAVVELRTPRLRLRQWVDADLEPFAALNADRDVMRYLPGTLGREESDAYAAVRRAAIAEHGHGMWAVEVVDGAPFAGMVGLAEPEFEARFTPAVTVGWRFAREHWGRGYASEAARAAIAFGFESLGLEEILAWTTVENAASRRVMERIGMTRDAADDFDHPLRSPDDPTRPQVLYRLRRPNWLRVTPTPARQRRRPVPRPAPRIAVPHLRLVTD
jgi:ribosomal-protein-alanine N-acetyltransferase